MTAQDYPTHLLPSQPVRSTVYPSKTLLEGGRYTPKDWTNITNSFARQLLALHAGPDTADSYQQDQINEHASMQVRSYR